MGYDRETNPRLSKIPGIVAYHDCLTQSNATHKSVPILLSPATAEDFSVLYHSKGLLAAFREAGYHTTFVSNEPRNHSFNDHLGEQADTTIFLRDYISGDPKDTLLLPYVSQTLALVNQHPHQLIVLHSYGSHSTYSDRYESYQSYFRPDNVVKATADCRDILINAYDNTIRLTDHFLASIIDMLSQSGRPSALVYTSDHGEDIYDDERNLYLHASPWPSYYQLHTPLLFWFSQGYDQLYPQRTSLVAKHRKDPVQSDCIFPTMLTLGGITTNIRQDTLSLASPSYRIKAQRHYINDHNCSVTLDRCLEPLDFAQLKKRNLRPY
jgi:glucan phosphoethanolaminetransferase (alkaline phosphatase superfamily)